jgi:hypothetical protein
MVLSAMTQPAAPSVLTPLSSPLAERHDRILILDFGSQVTQLIARRVRESGVYCEVWPFNAAPERAHRAPSTPKGNHPVRRAGLA